MIGETAVKVTPCTRGSRTPTLPKPAAWMIEAMPHVNRSALMRWTVSCGLSFSACAITSGTITAPA